MKFFFFLAFVLLMAKSANSLKCYNGTETIDCATTDKYCSKIKLDGESAYKYACKVDSDLTAGGWKAEDVKAALNCTTQTTGAKGEYCFCSDNDCNNPYSGLKCYKGDDAASAKNDTACLTGEDRCYKKTAADKTVSTMCFKSAEIMSDTMKDDGCMTKDDIEICLCKKDNCNNPTGGASQVVLSFVQMFAIIAFSSLLRLGMS